MSYALPQEVKTSKKFSSLPDDLASMAEQLVVKKFGLREEVRQEQSWDPFYGFEVGKDFRGGPISGVSTTDISLNGCHRLMQQLQRSFSRFRGGEAEWRMGRREFEYLVRVAGIGSTLSFRSDNPMLFGIPIDISETGYNKISLIYFM